MAELTPRQRQVLEYLQACLRESGRPPTVREVAAHFGWKSDNAARQHLRLMAQKGVLDLDAQRSRGIRLRPAFQAPDIREVPLLGRVAAGRPIEAIENLEGQVGLDPSLFPEADIFALRVKGDSMEGIGIRDSDLAIVRQTAAPTVGAVVVAMLNGEVTVKRYRLQGKQVCLEPENEAYETLVVGRQDEFEIFGVVIGIVRRL